MREGHRNSEKWGRGVPEREREREKGRKGEEEGIEAQRCREF